MSKFELLREAVANGDKAKILDMLKVAEADAKAHDARGDTLLPVAFTNAELSQTQLMEILEILLDRGLNINAGSEVGKTVLHLAVERRMTDVIDFCLNRNANPNFKNIRRNSIAHFAIEEECRKLNSLIQADATDNFESEENESSSFIDWMMSRGIDFFHTRNIARHSALDVAVNLNLQHILVTLLKRVSDLPSSDKDQPQLLCAFLERNATLYGLHLDPEQSEGIHSTHYKFRHVQNIVKMILEKSKSIDDETLAKAFRLANAAHLKMDVIEMLLQRISSVDRHHIDGESLIQSCADRFCQYGLRRTHLNHSVQENMAILRALMLKGVDANERDASGEIVAHVLFRRYPKLEMLELLKEVGVDFDARAPNGTSFLDLVCCYGHEAGMINLVLTGSCDVNAANSKGDTPLQVAIRTQKDAIVRDLIEHGAEVNAVYADGSTPLSIVCARGQASIAEYLIDCGADLNYRDEHGKTLLHLTTCDKAVVRLLLNLGLDVNAKDKMGKTPLHYAMFNNALDVGLLWEAGARVDVRDKYGHSPLYDSVMRNDIPAIDVLVKFGADMQDQRILRQAMTLINQHHYSYFIRYLDRYSIKLIAAGLRSEWSWTDKEDMRKLFERCLAEVDLMKTIVVDDCTSICEFVRMKRNRRCAYANNEKLKNLLGDVAVREMFPNYETLISGCYYEAVDRKALLEFVIEVLNQLTEILLADLCTDKITSYLRNADLLCFVEACESVNMNVRLVRPS